MTMAGIDAVGESPLGGYPSQYPSVSMMDWTNGKPNSRFWILKLLVDEFSVGDKLVQTTPTPAYDLLEYGHQHTALFIYLILEQLCMRKQGYASTGLEKSC
jgi:hypothetical protein